MTVWEWAYSGLGTGLQWSGNGSAMVWERVCNGLGMGSDGPGMGNDGLGMGLQWYGNEARNRPRVVCEWSGNCLGIKLGWLGNETTFSLPGCASNALSGDRFSKVLHIPQHQLSITSLAGMVAGKE